tara:strand:- start:39 stop:521 length:483 start_codon:yes stop_codon:yes gene_type:complete
MLIEDITFIIKIVIGMKKPKHTGIMQMNRKSIDIGHVLFFVCADLWFLLVSLNLLPDLEIISKANNEIIKIKQTVANCAAAVILFIPIHTLNIPNVRVSREKYSTVPKSEITSMQTNAIPAEIAGRASGKLKPQNELRLYRLVTSRRLSGICRKAVLESK